MAQSKFLPPMLQLSRAPDSTRQAWNNVYHIDVSIGTSSLYEGQQTRKHISTHKLNFSFLIWIFVIKTLLQQLKLLVFYFNFIHARSNKFMYLDHLTDTRQIVYVKEPKLNYWYIKYIHFLKKCCDITCTFCYVRHQRLVMMHGTRYCCLATK